jgi:hypothetical protein
MTCHELNLERVAGAAGVSMFSPVPVTSLLSSIRGNALSEASHFPCRKLFDGT